MTGGFKFKTSRPKNAKALTNGEIDYSGDRTRGRTGHSIFAWRSNCKHGWRAVISEAGKQTHDQFIGGKIEEIAAKQGRVWGVIQGREDLVDKGVDKTSGKIDRIEV